MIDLTPEEEILYLRATLNLVAMYTLFSMNTNKYENAIHSNNIYRIVHRASHYENLKKEDYNPYIEHAINKK